jgi:hypothetical protein
MISLRARSFPSAGNRIPFHSEPVLGELIVHAPEGLQLYTTKRTADTKNAPVRPQEAIPTLFEDGAYHILLDEQKSGHWPYLR